MSEDFDWTPFEGDRWTAEKIGDELVGTIAKLAVERGQRGDVAVVTVTPKDGGADREVWCPIDLARKLAELKPQVGDLIAMKLVDLKHVGQPQPMKIFSVKTKQSEPATPDVDDDEVPF